MEERGVITIDPISSHVGCQDMEEFIPELRDQWFAFHDRTMRRRAIKWLIDAEVVDRAEAEKALAEESDVVEKSSDE